MTTVQVFDPAMCCSTGVCGTDVDPTLARFAADVAWLATQGVAVERSSLAQEPGRFATSTAVRTALETLGTAALPAVVVDDVLRSTGVYPDRAQLAAWSGLAADAPRPTMLLPLIAAVPGATDSCCGGSGGC